MKKFILKNGKEVRIGDEVIIYNTVPINEKTLPYLIKEEVLTQVESEEGCNCKECTEGKVPMDINFYIKKIADKLSWKSTKVSTLLSRINSVFPGTVYSMLLKEIAIELDKKYKNHIKDSSDIFVISVVNGNIVRLDKSYIKNYRNFSAFRTIEDANLACRILQPFLKRMFTDEDRK